MVRGWSTEERRSSVRVGTSEMRELRCSEVCFGSRRRRRSLLVVRMYYFGIREWSLQRTIELVGFGHFGNGVGGV
jgi:hypothetical protein